MRERRQHASRPRERLVKSPFVLSHGVTKANNSNALKFMNRLIHPILLRFSREN
jgi:hypothetical protein